MDAMQEKMDYMNSRTEYLSSFILRYCELPTMKQQLDIPLYTKIGPHWAEYIQKLYVESEGKGAFANQQTYFTENGILYNLTDTDRCVVGEPWHLTRNWRECKTCNKFGGQLIFDYNTWKQLERGLETFAKHYLKKHLGCKL